MGVFDFIKNAFVRNDEPDFNGILEKTHHELKDSPFAWWSLKAREINTFQEDVLTLSDKHKVLFIIKAVHKIQDHLKKMTHSYEEKPHRSFQISNEYMRQLLKSKLVMDDDDIKSVMDAFSEYTPEHHLDHIIYWPVNLLVNQIEKQIKDRGLSESLKETLRTLQTKVNAKSHDVKEQAKVLSKIEGLLFTANEGKTGVKPTFFPGDDEFGKFANETIRLLNEADKQHWFKLMLHVQKASGGKPSKKFLDESRTLFKELGADKFKQLINEWILFIASLKEKEVVHQAATYQYSTYEFLSSPNAEMIKGFIWSCTHFHDKTTLFNIAKLAERAYRKIPGKGPAAAGIGNACLYVLANSKGLDGVGHLSRLKLRIKQSSTQQMIENYLMEAATEQGVTIHEIEDMAVDDYGFAEGKREYEFDGYKAVLEITGVGKTSLSWFKPDGSPQKAIPTAVKEKFAPKLKKIKETIKQAELTVSAQRDRLDRMFKSNRTLTGDKFNEFYFSHGLMSFLSHKIIWIAEREGKKQAVLFFKGAWVDNKGLIADITMDDSVKFSLWHPVYASVEEIKTWREFMEQHRIVQPLKQAFREVYLLTDAEINTVTYSNRMAAHLLKQHQFNSLAKIRGWKYSLLGAYDDGRDNGTASMDLGEYGIRAEFWVNEVNADDAFNDAGIWNYVATDQVRFTDLGGNVKELIDIPAIILSEVLRDVDLFVGVASVGNDPAWWDSGGLPAYRDYWQSYSFGDLSEVAKTRRSILEKLLPRLKIANVASLKDKFLIIKGKLRTYKIHIGSTNILMEPNDQYLCIVPDRSKKDMPENVFLPFEGDSGLSVILSKAMLLAEDDKITDKTITSQINQK